MCLKSCRDFLSSFPEKYFSQGADFTFSVESIPILSPAGSLSLTTAQNQVPKDAMADVITNLVKRIGEDCKKNGGPDAFETFKQIPKHFEDCISPIVNVTILGQDIQLAAAKEVKIDTIFKKYCNKIPDVKKCVQNATNSIGLCLEPKEKETPKIIQNIFDSLLDFVCHNEGEHIQSKYALRKRICTF